MPNDEHVAILKKGVAAWNAWRDKNPEIVPDLSGADLRRARLRSADLSRAQLGGANLSRSDLRRARLVRAHLIQTNLSGANLTGAFLTAALMNWANLSSANLTRASFSWALLSGANLRSANLNQADLTYTMLAQTDLTGADLSGSHIYGVSAWSLKLKRTKQQNLVITDVGESEITADNIEVAQFIYLLLHNENIRHVIDTVTSKVVLILGRFTKKRKAVLDALREELRKHDYTPILFDFVPSARRDITETITLLARMARFIIADLTDPSSIPKELEAIVPHLAVPIQPLLASQRPYAMFKDHWKYHWVLPICRYKGLKPLLATLAENVIAPAERKVKDLEKRRRVFEAELTKPRSRITTRRG
jgi:Pentapeptide repeats (8 copies)